MQRDSVNCAPESMGPGGGFIHKWVTQRAGSLLDRRESRETSGRDPFWGCSWEDFWWT